jgi:hypothetical protein
MAKPKLNYQEQVADRFKSRAEAIALQIASAMGQASGTETLDPQKEIDMWNHRVDVDQAGNPVNASDLFAKGMPIEQVVDAIYPYRRRMTEYSRPNPSDRVKYAERMKKLTNERFTEGEDTSEDY